MLIMRGRRRLALFMAVALATGIAAFFVGRAFLAPEPPSQPSGELQPAVIPEQRPDIRLADPEGRMRALSEWDGRPLVINFWATWCAPCRREIPMLNALARDRAAEGLVVIGIAIDFREEVLKYLQATPIEYPVLIGEQDGMDAARAFGMETVGLPFTAFTDSRGRIATIHVGELHRPQADVILSAVQAVDVGLIDLAAAREQIRAGLGAIAADH